MKAVTISRYGGPEVLEYADIPAPRPKAGEVLVRVRAASVNPIDWLIRDGALRWIVRTSLPAILGVDLAGEVAEVGAGAKRLAVGDPVFAKTPRDLGAFAEYVALP